MNNIVLNAQQQQDLLSGKKTFEQIVKEKQEAKELAALKSAEYQERIAATKAAIENAASVRLSKAVVKLTDKIKKQHAVYELLKQGFDYETMVVSDVEPIKAQFDWAFGSDVYFIPEYEQYYWVNSYKSNGKWKQKIFPLTTEGIRVIEKIVAGRSKKSK